MSKALAICVETVGAESEPSRFMQCVAVPAGKPGLGLDPGGNVCWRSEAAACALEVSDDGRLALLRREGAPTVRLLRTGRTLDVAAGDPTVILDQDEIDFGGKRLRIHVHGTAPSIVPPAPLSGDAATSANVARPMPVRVEPPAPPTAPDEPPGPEKRPDPPLPIRDQPPMPPTPPIVPIRTNPPAPPVGLRIIGGGGPLTWILLLLLLGGLGVGIYWLLWR